MSHKVAGNVCIAECTNIQSPYFRKKIGLFIASFDEQILSCKDRAAIGISSLPNNHSKCF
jgi:hypothetical protein